MCIRDRIVPLVLVELWFDMRSRGRRLLAARGRGRGRVGGGGRAAAHGDEPRRSGRRSPTARRGGPPSRGAAALPPLAFSTLARRPAGGNTLTPTVTLSPTSGPGGTLTRNPTPTRPGTATDTEGGTLAGSLSGSSSRDGAIGSGAAFSVSSLRAGTHTITASVHDSSAATASDSIVVNILDPGGGGSGAPNNPYLPPPPVIPELVLLPTLAPVYPGTPITLTVYGGVPPYRAFTTDSTVLPVNSVVSVPAGSAARATTSRRPASGPDPLTPGRTDAATTPTNARRAACPQRP